MTTALRGEAGIARSAASVGRRLGLGVGQSWIGPYGN